MKNELLKGKVFYDMTKFKEAVEKAVLFYNTARPHMSINMMTPQEAAAYTGEIKKGWTSYRDIAIKIYKQRTSFQINVYFWERKLPYIKYR